MEIKFFTENAVLDLSNQKVSIQENNPVVSDKMLTKFFFPFEIYVDEDFLISFGDYLSYESLNLAKEIKGKLLFEGKIHDARLEIMSIEGNLLEGQIDFGFEDVPNFDKKLSDLPFEVVEVDDIHTYAAEVCKKKYPDTVFNFPKIHTKKYDQTQKMWDAFNGYYNDTIGSNDTLVMTRNVSPSEDNDWNIDNVNIIHPCPHILYLLKLGFKDVGLDLSGDILEDEGLLKSWVFSGGEYFRNKYILVQEHSLRDNKYITRNCGGNPTYCFYEYKMNINIEFIDKYRFDFEFTANELNEIQSLYIKVGDNVLNVPTSRQRGKFFISYFVTITLANTPVEIGFSFNEERRSGLPMLGSNDILNLKIRSTKGYENSDSNDVEELKIVNNENVIDLRRAVPDMTFGDYVNIIRNWFNYSLKIKNKTVVMNRVIGDKLPEIKDFREFEIARPKRTLLSKKSYLIKFEDLDNDNKLPSMFFDEQGNLLNGKERKDTEVIEVKGYPLPVKKAKTNSPETAYVMKDSNTILSLVGYDGLNQGKNHAIALDGFVFPSLLKNWYKWIIQRISSTEYEWKFYTDIESFSSYGVDDYIYAYNNIHLIKSIVKDKIADNTYEVTITTETVRSSPHNVGLDNLVSARICWGDDTEDVKIEDSSTVLVKVRELKMPNDGMVDFYAFSLDSGEGYTIVSKNKDEYEVSVPKGDNKIRLEVWLKNGQRYYSNELLFRRVVVKNENCAVFIAKLIGRSYGFKITYLDCEGTEKTLSGAQATAFCGKTIISTVGCEVINTNTPCVEGRVYSLEYKVTWSYGFREDGYVDYIDKNGNQVRLTIPQNDTTPRFICSRRIINRHQVSLTLTGNLCS
ncbi:hypothetical protein PG623_01375 [Riemerella anatipestifer]|nr:hypothetical protein [Riemerella anatipestifer]